MKTLPLIGYTDRLSVRPDETISFMISSKSEQSVTAKLFRSISADPNPKGPGIVETDASVHFPKTSFPSREQAFYPGSYGISETSISKVFKDTISIEVTIFPTLLKDAEQTIIQLDQFEVFVDGQGAVALRFDGSVVSTKRQIKFNSWHNITAKVSSAGHLEITQHPFDVFEETATNVKSVSVTKTKLDGLVVIAAKMQKGRVTNYFNGKIEAPTITVDGQIIANWDFAAATQTTGIKTDYGPELKLVNFPTRGLTGSKWDGSEMCWRHKPEHYGAIHFHEDDIYDFEWDSSFNFKIPADMPSGVYVMRIECNGYADAMPFYVAAPLGKPKAKLCVLISTFTYTIYGNHARPDYDPQWQKRIKEWNAYPYNPSEYKEYGLSTYNNHLDGSGICHASCRRPLFNLRPGYITFGNTPCSGLRHFQADSHLISWLHAKNIEYDVVTDEQLHRDGVNAIKGYDAVTTASHPEYHTSETLDALQDFRNNGGALHYLGGNGFYWRIAQHSQNESLLEIRRAEDGIRAWAAEPGEYYNAFDGSYGGLWRRNGRAPQELVGIGFTAQGEFYGHPYHRTCHNPDFDWVFEGIEGDILGDFGFSGNGAAGFELDHIDEKLGTFKETIILAQSNVVNGGFMLVPEEQLTHLTNLSGGSEEEALHADMIYFELPGGGSVFSTGSITFCGSLPWNNYENNISRLLENVFRKAIDY